MQRSTEAARTDAEPPSTTGRTRLAGPHAFRVTGEPAVVAAAEDVFRTFEPVEDDRERDVLTYATESVDGRVRIDVAGTSQSVQDAPAAMDFVQWHLNQHLVAQLTEEQTGLHAAAATLDGRLVLLPAASGCGKSTTVAGLVRAGWAYLTDEAAVLDGPSLEVLPYPKPVTLDAGSWPLFPLVQERIRSEESCLVPTPLLHPSGDPVAALGRRAAVAAVVSPWHVEGAETRLEPLTPGELLMLLAQSTFAFNEDGTRHLRRLAEVARHAPGYRLVIGDLEAAVDVIAGVLRGGA